MTKFIGVYEVLDPGDKVLVRLDKAYSESEARDAAHTLTDFFTLAHKKVAILPKRYSYELVSRGQKIKVTDNKIEISPLKGLFAEAWKLIEEVKHATVTHTYRGNGRLKKFINGREIKTRLGRC